MIATLRSALYMLIFYTGSAGIVIAAALAIPFGRRGAITSALLWARFHYWCARWLLGIEVRVEGALPASPVLIAVKHEAMVETTEILRLFGAPAVVFKAELLRIPLWGRIARLHGVIPVEREAGARAMRAMLTAARAAVAERRSIVIFPEGTRIPHGQVAPLRPGFAGLYKILGLPVVPVAVDSGRLWPRHGFAKRAGTVTFRIGAPIPPGLARDEIETRTNAAINALNLP